MNNSENNKSKRQQYAEVADIFPHLKAAENVCRAIQNANGVIDSLKAVSGDDGRAGTRVELTVFIPAFEIAYPPFGREKFGTD